MHPTCVLSGSEKELLFSLVDAPLNRVSLAGVIVYDDIYIAFDN